MGEGGEPLGVEGFWGLVKVCFFHSQKMHFFLIDTFPVIAVGKN